MRHWAYGTKGAHCDLLFVNIWSRHSFYSSIPKINRRIRKRDTWSWLDARCVPLFEARVDMNCLFQRSPAGVLSRPAYMHLFICIPVQFVDPESDYHCRTAPTHDRGRPFISPDCSHEIRCIIPQRLAIITSIIAPD